MKEIVDSIWNSTPDQVYTIFLLWCLGYILIMIISYFIYKHISKKMGFGKDWDKKFKGLR